MPITVKWHTPESVIVVYTPGWDWSDFAQSGRDLRALLDEATGTTPIIIDVSDIGRMPTGSFSSLPSVAQKSPLFWHPNAGRVIVVGPDSMVRTVGTVFRKVFAEQAERMTYVDTLEQAEALIAEDPTE
ncbi:MAG: hypothetical protein GYB64_01945 [Chloroflexi bacterium]|nr:hypothetical protein [Chloroflexota bacterium]